MEFLDLLESFRAQDAHIERLYTRQDGVGVRGAVARRRSPRYLAQLAEAAALVEKAMVSRRAALMFQEAMSTDDFPLLFGDILDRQLLANYQETPQTFRQWCRIGTVPDFRAVKRFTIDGGQGLLDEVAQSAPYPEVALSEGKYEYSVKKYGRRMPFTWEAMINDDMGALRDVPARFGRAARRSEEYFATGLVADANGPHASLYTAGNKNQIIVANGAVNANPVLGAAGLQDAWTVLASQLDADGQPILIDMAVLMVPPALEVTANNLLKADTLSIGIVGQGAVSAALPEQRLLVSNWMRSRVTLVVNPYLPIISTTNGNTSWYLFASPSVGRPAVEIGFLRGHETPEMFLATPNAQRIGGGGEDPLNGNFENDSIDYKVRHVFGGVRMDPKSTVASNGSGS